MFEFLSEKLKKKLQNIDNSSLRGEHKTKIYSRYALLSMRYHLSVHDIHKTHLDKLDNMATEYLKQAGTVLGQAQLKLEIELWFTKFKICCIKLIQLVKLDLVW